MVTCVVQACCACSCLLSSEGSYAYTGICLSFGGAVKPVSWGVAIIWQGAISCTNGSLTIHWSVSPEFGQH